MQGYFLAESETVWVGVNVNSPIPPTMRAALCKLLVEVVLTTPRWLCPWINDACIMCFFLHFSVNRRPIAETEIGLAILRVSLDEYCNPSINHS